MLGKKLSPTNEIGFVLFGKMLLGKMCWGTHWPIWCWEKCFEGSIGDLFLRGKINRCKRSCWNNFVLEHMSKKRRTQEMPVSHDKKFETKCLRINIYAQSRPSVRPSVRRSVRPPACPSAHPSVRLSVRQSVRPPARPPVRLSVDHPTKYE